MSLTEFARRRTAASRLARLVPPLVLLIICSVTNIAAAENVYPNGVAPTAAQRGVFPGSDAGSCCWLGSSASLKLLAPAGADAIVVTIFIPSYALANGQLQSMMIKIGSAPQTRVCCLGIGIHELAFAVPKRHARLVNVTLQMSKTFIPAQIGIGNDRRELSVLLRSVEWRNTLGAAVTSTLDRTVVRALLALYALIFVCAAITTYWRPALGAALMIITSPFALYVPIDGTTLTLPKAIVIAVALGLCLRLPTKALPDKLTAGLLAAQALLALAFLVSLHNAAFHVPVWREFFKELQYGLTGLVAFVAIRLDDSKDRLNLIRLVLLCTVVAVSLLALSQERTGAPMGVFLAGHELSRIAGPLEGPNQLGAFFGISLPFILAFLLKKTKSYIDLAVLVLGCITAVLTFSRGGVTALIVALALVFFAVRARHFERAAYAVYGVLFTGMFIIACLQFAGHGSPALSRITFGRPTGAANFNGGLGTRAQLWHGAYVLWRSHPWFGIGAGNYELRVAQTGAPGVRTHANSAYFQTLAEEGLGGFIALALLIFASLRLFARDRSSVFSVAALAVLLALWFHQITDYVTFYPKVGVFLWTMLGVASATRFQTATISEDV